MPMAFRPSGLSTPSKNSIVVALLQGDDRLLPVRALADVPADALDLAAHDRSCGPRSTLTLNSVSTARASSACLVASSVRPRTSTGGSSRGRASELLGDERTLDDVLVDAWLHRQRAPPSALRGLGGEHERVVPQDVVDVEALGRQERRARRGCARCGASVVVRLRVDDQRASSSFRRFASTVDGRLGLDASAARSCSTMMSCLLAARSDERARERAAAHLAGGR